MGVSWHEHVLVLVALLYELVEENLHLLGDILQLVACEQLQIDEHLVVARASAVYLLAHVAQFLGEHSLYLRVNVFHAVVDDKLSAFADAVDVFQFGEQRRELFLLEQSDAFEHGDVSHGAEYVVFGEIEVHLAVASYGEAFDLLVYLKVFFPEFHSSCYIKL